MGVALGGMSMELTDQEQRLIEALRQLDKVNPSGADGYSSAGYLPHLIRIAEGLLPSAKEAHERFLKESARDHIVDLVYYRAPRYEDGKHIKKRG